jgi:DNA replication protein DnaC
MLTEDAAMDNRTHVQDLCHRLHLPAVARDAERLAAEAARQGTDHRNYLTQLLEVELEERAERRAARRVKEAGFPIVKTLDGFNFGRAPHLPEAHIRDLAAGAYIDKAEPVLFVGDPGTGKTHLATALGVAAAYLGRSVRFATAGRLVTELIEARDARELGRVVARYTRVDLLIVDELAYVPLSKADAELLFRVLGERHEQRPIVITTNLPFSEWTSIFPDPRLCKAVVDRLTHRSHIIDTGKESIRLEEALTRKGMSRRIKKDSPEPTPAQS